MLLYVFAGLALGAIYAIASASLVVTFASAGVLNFAFGAMAFFVARFYYWMNTQHGANRGLSAVVALLVVAPIFGVFLWGVLFRHLRLRSSLIKLVATIGLSVAIPPAAQLLFGNASITSAPGLAPTPVRVFHFLGAPVDLNAVITYACVLAVVLLGTVLLRYTDAGLRVRAMVDSEALTSLSGTSPSGISLAVWAVSGLLAGLAGILVAPTNGLTTGGMTTLMAAAFAAVVAARLRSVPIAVGVSLLMGLVTDIIQKYISPSSAYSGEIIPSIPFAFILVFLVIYVVRGGGGLDEGGEGGGPLDRAIQTQLVVAGSSTQAARAGLERVYRLGGGALVVVAMAVFPLIFHNFWLGLVSLGFAYAIVMLSFTLVTGEGGMIWLCQITFAGGGAVGAAQLATVEHLPVLLAIVIAALIVMPVGALVGILTIRVGSLYVGLVTLSFGLLVDALVFTQDRFFKQGLGVPLVGPAFAHSPRVFAYLTLVVFLVIGVLVLNLRRSTAGLALAAIRSSEPAAATLGVSVLQMKVLVSAVAAFVAAIGGAFLAIDNNGAIPTSFATFGGIVWLAVLVTVGVRSILGAGIAGLLFTMVPGLVSVHVSSPTSRWLDLPPILFGLGAVGLAKDPDGFVITNTRRARLLLVRVLPGGKEDPESFAMAPGSAEAGAPPTAPVLAQTAADRPAGAVKEIV
jgi:branched-chain amino acid transport system permease protein